jgi:hypothetical protein
MVEEILVKEILSQQEIAAGKGLLERLDNDDSKVIAAYWIYTTDPIPFWRLEFVSPLVDSDGPLEFYTKIQNLLSASPKLPCHLGLNIINVLGPSYSFYKSLRSAIKPERNLSNVRLSQFPVGNDIADIYIYRFPKNGSAH